MQVHFIGLDFSHSDQGEHEHVTLEMTAPPSKGTRIIFNGGTVYVVTHDPEYFINTGPVPWNENSDHYWPDKAWIEACWVLVHEDRSPAEMQRSSVDPREGMDEKERARFDKQIAELIAEVHHRMENEAEPVCPQCGRPCSTTTWRQDDCTPRGNPYCYKSHDQMFELRAMAKGC